MNFEDLTQKTTDELLEMRAEIDRAIVFVEKRNRDSAIAEIHRIAREHGFSIEELVGKAPAAKRKLAPKYINPENPDQTWSGRGRRPKWLEDSLAAGKSLDDFLIDEKK